MTTQQYEDDTEIPTQQYKVDNEMTTQQYEDDTEITTQQYKVDNEMTTQQYEVDNEMTTEFNIQLRVTICDKMTGAWFSPGDPYRRVDTSTLLQTYVLDDKMTGHQSQL